jgi:DNA-binding beta-propeller fold protein YncE
MSRCIAMSLLLALLIPGSLVHATNHYDPTTQQFTADGQSTEQRPATSAGAFTLEECLFGTDVAEANLIEIDKLTAQATVIGSLQSPICAGLAYDETSGLLYATDTSTRDLVSIDPATGATTVIGYTGIELPHGAAIDPGDGTLYVCASGSTTELYRVDKITAAATMIGEVGYPHIGALDFDPTSGILYGAHAYATADGFLITIDTATGQGTFVADTHRINGLSFDAAGVLYAAENGLSAGVPSVLLTIDKLSGAWTEIGDIPADNVLGLVFSSSGGSTPVTATTWGRIKEQFRR